MNCRPRVALITGAARGIGLATAKWFLDQGHALALVDIDVGIRVNEIAPGPLNTAVAKRVHSNAIRRDYHDSIPLGRHGRPQEIAASMGLLCSDAANYINGQCLAVDGGFDAMGIGLPSMRAVRGKS